MGARAALAVRRFGLQGPIARGALALNENFNALGIAVIAVFAAAWAVSYLIFRAGGRSAAVV